MPHSYGASFADVGRFGPSSSTRGTTATRTARRARSWTGSAGTAPPLPLHSSLTRAGYPRRPERRKSGGAGNGRPTPVRRSAMAHKREDEDPGLPIKLGPCSERRVPPPDPVVRGPEALARARGRLRPQRPPHRRLRREFLLSVCGAATTLLALNACSSDEGPAGPPRPGGTFEIPTTAATDTTRRARAGRRRLRLRRAGSLPRVPPEPRDPRRARLLGRLPAAVVR
jgi:hypothetical protein